MVSQLGDGDGVFLKELFALLLKLLPAPLKGKPLDLEEDKVPLHTNVNSSWLRISCHAETSIDIDNPI